MKLICSKSNLLHGVNIVSKAVPTRTTMAILECILIDASANEIKLTAFRSIPVKGSPIESEIAELGRLPRLARGCHYQRKGREGNHCIRC